MTAAASSRPPPASDAPEPVPTPDESSTSVKRRRRPRPARATDTHEATVIPLRRIQGNWKRRPGVATRYELLLAVGRLLATGQIVIADGVLRLSSNSRREYFEPLTAQQRWYRADEELREYCQRMDVHETRSANVNSDPQGYSQGSNYEATSARGSPRRGVEKYIRRELSEAGSLGYEETISVIFEKGGLEWVLEEWQPKRRTKT